MSILATAAEHSFLIDAIGPFFDGHRGKRINWSKIPFAHLEERPETWEQIRADMRKFCKEVSGLGYNAVSLDDVAHLYHHPLHDEVLRQRIAFLRKEFHQLFQIARDLPLR